MVFVRVVGPTVSCVESTVRGSLCIYLGAAPGVGKTYAMLSEARRNLERGTDVVAGCVETRGRTRTEALLDGLEAVPGPAGGGASPGLDVDAVLARHPRLVLVDDLAHTNAPGSRNAKRWQDVEELLRGGIDVVSAVGIQDLESLGDVVASITGVRPAQSVPDEVVRAADRIELVDMSPQALRRRLAHGALYPPDQVDAALSHYFRPGNLTALRELALLWVADRADEYLRQYRAEHRISATWPARERIVVGLTGGPEGRTLIRRAARLAAKASGGEVLAVHVVRSDGGARGGSGSRSSAAFDGTGASALPEESAAQRALVEDLGGSYHQVVGEDVATAMLDFAHGVDATQIVLGTSRRPAWRYVFGPGVGATVARLCGPDLDVHIVNHDQAAVPGAGLPVARGARLGRTRVVAGWLTGVAGPLLVTAALTPGQGGPSLATDMLLYLTLTVAAALLGGLYPALTSAVGGSLLLNYYFTPPTHTFTIDEGDNVVALVVFVVVAAAVASVVDLAARRTQQAARLQSEAEILSYLAGSVLRGEHTLAALLERVRETFGMESAALWERDDVHAPWRRAGSAQGAGAAGGGRGRGEPGMRGARTEGGGPEGGGPDGTADGGPGGRPEDADVEVAVNDRLLLTLTGRVLPASDRRVLSAFAAQAAGVLDRQRLADEAARARELAEGNRIRTALLAAVSHDLRTPLAGIKASVTSLRADDVAWSAQDEAELLAGIEEGADRLDHLVGNLLDMSRLQTGTVTPLIGPVDLDDVVPMALAGVPRDRVVVDIPEDLPVIAADPGLLERSVANVVENAVKYSPDGEPVLVAASALGGRVELRVADRGPGVPGAARDGIFEPFQRYGDAPRGNGVGLGLAVARGFAEAMGGTLAAEDTPGGGLTMVLTLRAAQGPRAQYGRAGGPATRRAGPDGARGGSGGSPGAGPGAGCGPSSAAEPGASPETERGAGPGAGQGASPDAGPGGSPEAGPGASPVTGARSGDGHGHGIRTGREAGRCAGREGQA
jgi:two-component system sensor histidine kinase KdpD